MARAYLDEEELDTLEAALILLGSNLSQTNEDTTARELLITKIIQKVELIKRMSRRNMVSLEPMA